MQLALLEHEHGHAREGRDPDPPKCRTHAAGDLGPQQTSTEVDAGYGAVGSCNASWISLRSHQPVAPKVWLIKRSNTLSNMIYLAFLDATAQAGPVQK